MAIDFTRLAKIHRMACEMQVSWSLHYDESDGTWWFGIGSAAPVECWAGKNQGFPSACSDVEDWLKLLSTGWNKEEGRWNGDQA